MAKDEKIYGAADAASQGVPVDTTNAGARVADPQVHAIVWRHFSRYAEPADSVDAAVRSLNYIEDCGEGASDAIVVGPLTDPKSWENCIRDKALTDLRYAMYDTQSKESEERRKADTRPICAECKARGLVSITAPDGEGLTIECEACEGNGRVPATREPSDEVNATSDAGPKVNKTNSTDTQKDG